MRAVDRGDTLSKRGAEILVPDPTRTFDPTRSTGAGLRSYNAGAAQTKTFYSDRKTTLRPFGTRDFYGSKVASASERSFTTKDARSTGNYEIPNATRAAETKTMPTGAVHDAGKTASADGFAPGSRTFLGKERDRLNNEVQWDSRAGWNGSLQPMTIEDVRNLLNKNR